MNHNMLIESLKKKVKKMSLASCLSFSFDSSKEEGYNSPYEICSICYFTKKLENLNCGHKFCSKCIDRLLIEEIPRCALCRSEIQDSRYQDYW